MSGKLRLVHAVAFAAVALLVAACGGDDGHEPDPGSNAALTALAVEQVALIPSFASDRLDYTAEVANSVTSTRVVPTAANPAASVRVNGTIVASGSTSGAIALTEGSNTLTIVVTAQNGTTMRTYTVAVSRRPPPGTNANLASLALTAAPLDQLFDPTVESYTASVGYLGTSTRVVAAAEDANASLQLNGSGLELGALSDPVLLDVGGNELTLLVTAEDLTSTRSYDVQVGRGSLAAVRQEAYVKASNAGPDRFGASLTLRGDTLVVGAPEEDSGATGIGGNQSNDALSNAGAAYVFERNGSDWHQSAYVKASNPDAGDRFGGAVALDGDLLAVGATGEDSAAIRIDGNQTDDGSPSAGAVYAFVRDGFGAWHPSAYIKASNAESGDEFGNAVSLDDGRLLVGAHLEDSAATGVDGDQNDNSLNASGAAFLFGRDDTGAWQRLAYLKATNSASLDEFGRSVAISGDALAVGAPGEDGNAGGVDGDQSDDNARDAGAAYLFTANSSGGWSPAAYVKAANPRAFDAFGAAVALDGDLLAVGAPGQNSNAAGIDGDELDQSMLDAGAVYVFEHDADDGWRQTAFIKASNPSAFDEFGATVALQGNLLAVGAPGQNSSATGIDGDERDQSMLDAGAVYLFELSAAGGWSQIAFLKASNTDAGDAFGGALDVDGDTAVAGAQFEDSASRGVDGNEDDDSQSSTGAVYVVR